MNRVLDTTVPDFVELHASCMRLAGMERLDEAWAASVAFGGDKQAVSKFQDHFGSLGR